jgi:hypothetical protein
LKIIILAPHSFENQLTTEDIEQAVFDSGFTVTEVLSIEEDIGVLWADIEGIPYSVYRIDWNDISECEKPKINKWGKPYNAQAGIQRNQKLVQNADGLILFWSETDKVSEYIIKEMKKANKRVHFQKPQEEFVF